MSRTVAVFIRAVITLTVLAVGLMAGFAATAALDALGRVVLQ